MKTRKYRNKKVDYNGITFDSKKELERYKVLIIWQNCGVIKDLTLQKRFELIPSQVLKTPRKQPNGGYQRTEQNICYVADFCYTDIETGKFVVEDTKGVKTADYIIKRKLMKYVHGIEIVEI